MVKNKKPTTFVIKLRGAGTQRDIHGLRFLLKRAWREYELKCVGAGFVATDGAVASAGYLLPTN
jgi:hypothetical protein